MKACGLIERFDFNLAAVLGMFDEDTVSSLFEHITEFINNNDDANAALRFVDNFFNVDTMANLEAVIKRLYPEVEERSVDVYFDTKELNVYEYNGSPISLTAHAYDANGNKLTGGVRYFYSGYQVNGEIYMSTNAPALPGVYVVNAVYFDLSNGIRQLDYGYASKAYTITSKEVTFSLNGEELNDLTVEYDGTPKALKVVAKYSDGNLAKAGTLKVVYMDKDGNASFDAPTLPGEYTVVAVYAEKDGDDTSVLHTDACGVGGDNRPFEEAFLLLETIVCSRFIFLAAVFLLGINFPYKGALFLFVRFQIKIAAINVVVRRLQFFAEVV
jgi:hypothetical protein